VFFASRVPGHVHSQYSGALVCVRSRPRMLLFPAAHNSCCMWNLAGHFVGHFVVNIWRVLITVHY